MKSWDKRNIEVFEVTQATHAADIDADIPVWVDHQQKALQTGGATFLSRYTGSSHTEGDVPRKKQHEAWNHADFAIDEAQLAVARRIGPGDDHGDGA